MPKSPTLLRMVTNFAKDLAKFTKAGAPVVDRFEYEDRVSTCLSCEHLKNKKRCGLCGCVVEVKAAWATAECPDGRWKPNPTQNGRKNHTNNPS